MTSVTAAGFLYLTFSVSSADMAVVYQCISALFMLFTMATYWDIVMDTIPNNTFIFMITSLLRSAVVTLTVKSSHAIGPFYYKISRFIIFFSRFDLV